MLHVIQHLRFVGKLATKYEGIAGTAGLLTPIHTCVYYSFFVTTLLPTNSPLIPLPACKLTITPVAIRTIVGTMPFCRLFPAAD
jgi:hypothetical protein